MKARIREGFLSRMFGGRALKPGRSAIRRRRTPGLVPALRRPGSFSKKVSMDADLSVLDR
jgi:hypothetical protein